MSYILTDIGEEWYAKTALEGETVTVGLYNDSTDNISDGDGLSAVSTEPSGSYSRQSSTISVSDIGGDWGFDNDSEMVFSTSTSSQTVDGAFMLADFNSAETGSSTDNFVATAELSQSRDLSQVDQLTINPNELGVTVN